MSIGLYYRIIVGGCVSGPSFLNGHRPTVNPATGSPIVPQERGSGDRVKVPIAVLCLITIFQKGNGIV